MRPGSTLRPVRASTREGSNVSGGRGSGRRPSITGSEGSPPHSSRIMRVASSSPGTTKPGSTPRAKRYWASETSDRSRPVWAVRIGSNQADSTNTSVVASDTPVDAPPITPPRSITPEASAITVMSGVRA